eukprot:TRINITY_DN9967_c0_g1_i1.p1 TRINITY_DN9967_c0_g1~~TRINITY_DN9967_c0_g1_i1.p1  ORF type:complete len:159 (-),score=25.36 TRINITY_DN9967_c0_g1_i1:6-482(-)
MQLNLITLITRNWNKQGKKIDSVSSYLNSQKKDSEDREKLLDAVRRIIGNVDEIVLPHRLLKHEAEVIWTDDNKSRVHGYLYVFNDAIMYTKKKTVGEKEKMIALAYYSKKFIIYPKNDKTIIMQVETGDVKFVFDKQSQRDETLNLMEQNYKIYQQH